MIVKLGPKAHSFSDISTGLTLAPGEEKEVTAQFNSSIVREALRWGHLVKVVEEEVEEVVIPIVDNTERKNALLQKTREQIMAEFSFLIEEDLATAKKLNKTELVEFLLSVEESYE